MANPDIDTIALEVARRFTLDTEPQRRAQLQVAIIEAIKQSTEHRQAGVDAAADGLDVMIDISELRAGWRIGWTPTPNARRTKGVSERPYSRDQAALDGVACRLAGEIGVFYKSSEACTLEMPFYAFTTMELCDFAHALRATAVPTAASTDQSWSDEYAGLPDIAPPTPLADEGC